MEKGQTFKKIIHILEVSDIKVLKYTEDCIKAVMDTLYIDTYVHCYDYKEKRHYKMFLCFSKHGDALRMH